jgi:hypothetical protein
MGRQQIATIGAEHSTVAAATRVYCGAIPGVETPG